MSVNITFIKYHQRARLHCSQARVSLLRARNTGRRVDGAVAVQRERVAMDAVPLAAAALPEHLAELFAEAGDLGRAAGAGILWVREWVSREFRVFGWCCHDFRKKRRRRKHVGERCGIDVRELWLARRWGWPLRWKRGRERGGGR